MLVMAPLVGLALHSDQSIAIYQFASDYVTGPLHPLSFFPFFLITLAVALLLVPLYIASDKAMKTGNPAPRLALPALVGLLAAMTFELMYLLPLTCITLIVLRAWLSGLTWRDVPSTAAFQRWIALCLGFLTVFVPSRIAIATACAANDCYGNTNPVPSGFSIGQWLGRFLSGLPVEGWFSTHPGPSIRARWVGPGRAPPPTYGWSRPPLRWLPWQSGPPASF